VPEKQTRSTAEAFLLKGMMQVKNFKTALDASKMEGILKQMAADILSAEARRDTLALIGIHTRGVFLARRLQSLIRLAENIDIPCGAMDINLYRDDWTRSSLNPVVRKTDIAFDVDDRQIILVDDVLYTGRTIRAAMDALMDFGRPARIELAVLVDRGHRELPIQANYTGIHIQTDPGEAVNVLLMECDDADRVDVVTGQ
jgi:pyrimidine operon attenuation protein / uracil phosphoribosyltransferase